MSMLKRAAVVLTLKWTIPPLFTLISVANPWIVESPEPVISHSLEGFPVRLFSQTMGFDPHWAPGLDPVASATPTTTRTMKERRRAGGLRDSELFDVIKIGSAVLKRRARNRWPSEVPPYGAYVA